MADNPLFATTPAGDTLLDRYTRFVFPARLVEELNKEILPRPRGFPPINGWSLTHFLYGLTWPALFGDRAFLYHNLFEVFELLAGGFFTKRPFTREEFIDIVLDNAFFLAGAALVKK